MNMEELINLLNVSRNNYYNNSKSELSDYEYDRLFDELVEMEKSTGVVMCNSPTQEVGYEVLNKLKKSTHKYPMLSLDKTKKSEDLINFAKGYKSLLMFKLDGLTCAITYNEDGVLELCETRGNGEVGSDITHNAKTFVNLPWKINHKGGLTVFGEAVIDYPTFYKINEKLSKVDQYKNPRNLCSGSVQQLDSKICSERGVRFIAWRLVKGYENNSFKNRLEYLEKLGFEVVQAIEMPIVKEQLDLKIEEMRMAANKIGLPIDGLVCGFDDVKYGESLGATTHHLKSQIAFKYGEDREFSTLRKIEWNPSRTGQINPIAIFDTIELANTEVSRASLHNLSIMENLNVKIGATVEVSKRNEIIPCIENCDGNGNDIIIPDKCPICGGATEIRQDGDSKFLFCTSDTCKAKLLSRLELFVGKEGMDVQGLSSATLDYFIKLNWITTPTDIYFLKEHESDMLKLPGFGKKSVENLLNSIENSKNVKLAAFIRALGIPMIGKTQSKALAQYCEGSEIKFRNFIDKKIKFSEIIEGFGEKMDKSIDKWFGNNENVVIYNDLVKILSFREELKEEKKQNNINLHGLAFCITGKLVHFDNRDALIKAIEEHGGKYTSSVSAKTNYLINNDKESQSSKNKKMKDLGGEIISEEDFLLMLK